MKQRGPVGTPEITRLYGDFLLEFTRNSKPLIMELTAIAAKYKNHVEGIANAILDRIVEVPVERKLPSWYLLDSILKNVGDQYRLYFAGRLDTIFIDTCRKLSPSLLPVMVQLFRTWGKFIPSFARYSIEDFLQNDHTPVSSEDLRHSGSHSPHLSHGHVIAKYLEAHLRMEHSTVWDPLSENGILEEENQIPSSNELGNRISLHKQHGTPNVIVGKKITFLQETCFDEACSYLVYAPVDMEAMNMCMYGGDPGKVQIMPSGFTKVPVERKLPSWYLLDSILKNVGDQYRLYFAGRLDTIFIDTCRKLSPSLLPVMVQLFRTWGKFIPSFARYSIEDFLQKEHAPVSSEDLRHSGSHSPHLSHGHVIAKYLEAHLRMEHSTVWDPLSENGILEEANQIPTSNELGNRISLHKQHGHQTLLWARKQHSFKRPVSTKHARI